MCASLYYPIQFNYITYEASSGGLSVPESDQRIAYYAISGFPTLKFDGYTTVVGAGASAADGSEYIPIIETHFLNTTPVEVRVTDYSFTPGSSFVDVKVKLYGNLANIANTYIRVALVENQPLLRRSQPLQSHPARHVPEPHGDGPDHPEHGPGADDPPALLAGRQPGIRRNCCSSPGSSATATSSSTTAAAAP